MNSTHSQHEQPLFMEGELTVFTVGRYANLPTQWQNTSGDVTLDLSGLTEIDTAGIQLLAWFRRELEQEHRQLILINASPVVQDALELLGVSLIATPHRDQSEGLRT